jgi:hypothetical protein
MTLEAFESLVQDNRPDVCRLRAPSARMLHHFNKTAQYEQRHELCSFAAASPRFPLFAWRGSACWPLPRLISSASLRKANPEICFNADRGEFVAIDNETHNLTVAAQPASMPNRQPIAGSHPAPQGAGFEIAATPMHVSVRRIVQYR